MREHSRFEKARVIGARALQISMGAPVDIKVPEDIIDPTKSGMSKANVYKVIKILKAEGVMEDEVS